MIRPRHSGRCRCDALRVTAREEPFWRSYCHCTDCRGQTGAPVTVFVGFRDEHLDWSGTPHTWKTGPVTRGFCGRCGSQIFYRDDRLAGETYLYLGFLDRPGDLAPTLHAFDGRRLPFLEIKDELPRFPGFSIER